jgi:transcriptional regulator with XRE-family HTH domain
MAWDPQPRARSPEEQLGYKVIGQLIAVRRRRLGWSQRYLEDRSGIDQAVISRVENGKQFGVRWARFAALVGAMGGLGDEPHPRHRPVPPWEPTRAPIDLSRGGLSNFDEDQLLELNGTAAPGAVTARNAVQSLSAESAVDRGGGLDTLRDADD